MPETIRNIFKGLSSVCVIIPDEPDKSTYCVKTNRMEDFDNLRKDAEAVGRDFARTVDKAKELFYVR